MSSEIRVVSIGGSGHFYLAAGLGKIPGLAYVGAAGDGYGGPARLLGGEGSAPLYDNWRRMLDETRPDAATLGCWYAHNGAAALECLRRGIHVITDKPAVNSWEELAEAEALCAGNPSLHFITEFAMRMDPPFAAARQAVQAGRIGRPVLISAQKSYKFGASRPDFYKQRAHFGGIVMWVASHALDFARWVSGLEYVRFQGLQGNLTHPEYGEMEDHLALLMELSGGAKGVLTADFLRPAKAPTHGDDRLRIVGAQGVIEVRDGECRLLSNNGEPELLAQGAASALDVAQEYVATLRGAGQGIFSSAETLITARALLAARDAADQ
jgi:predicted dehydrogenase